jgi:DNA-binding NarL/FixJ family response regulator
MNKPKVLLADDHQIVLQGLKTLLDGEFDLVGFAADGRDMIEKARRLQPDVIVADVSMPLLNGIDACRQLRDEGCDAKVVFLTMHPDAVYATRALEAGALGYVLKHSAPDELVAAIHAALRGDKHVSTQLRTPAMEEFLDETRRGVRETIELTGRQREVLQLLAEGKSAKEIGGILNISPRTVETHKYKMMDDLGVKTSAQLVQYAIKHGLV